MKELGNDLLVYRFEQIVRKQGHIWNRYNIYKQAKDIEMKSYWLDQFNRQCHRIENIRNLILKKLAR